VKTVVSNPRTTARAAGDAGMTEAVVARALLAVGENGVASLHSLKRSSDSGCRDAVRMVLQGKLAIGALDFLIAGGTRDAQHLVIVAFHCRGQNCYLLNFDLLGIVRHPHHRRTQQALF